MGDTYVDTREFRDYMRVVSAGTKRVTRRVMSDMAKDAALLARAHEPHNMPRDDITWDFKSALGPAVHGVGAPAGYNDAGRGITMGMRGSRFRHPVFASQNIPRKDWNWADQKDTKPFIEIAAAEVAQDSELLMSVALQNLFDKA